MKQAFGLEEKVAVITGGAGLLGKKHAEAITEFGGIPILLDIDKTVGIAKSKKISDKYQVDSDFYSCDITDESQIISVRDSLLLKYGKIDILINNAAIDPKFEQIGKDNLSRLENFSLDQWNLELSVGLTGAMLCSKIFGYEMVSKGKGVILNISSDLGIIAPNQRIYKKEGIPEREQPVKPVTYSVIKHGLVGLTKYLTTYWAGTGVRCNSLCPGGVYTNQSKDFVQKLTDLIPLGRMANIDEYNASVVFLVSEASSYMNGSNVVVDGGWTAI